MAAAGCLKVNDVLAGLGGDFKQRLAKVLVADGDPLLLSVFLQLDDDARDADLEDVDPAATLWLAVRYSSTGGRGCAETA